MIVSDKSIDRVEAVGAELWSYGSDSSDYLIVFPDTRTCWNSDDIAIDLICTLNIHGLTGYAPKSVAIRRANAKRVIRSQL